MESEMFLAFAGVKLTISEAMHRYLVEIYGNSEELMNQYRRADAWLVANPSRPKRNQARFIVNWLNKECRMADVRGAAVRKEAMVGAGPVCAKPVRKD